MGVVIANLHIQEAEALKYRLHLAKDEEERKVISRELDIAGTKRQLENSRFVRLRNLMW